MKTRSSSFLFVVLCLAVTAFAQTSRGTVSGVVTDTAGAVVSGATVVLTKGHMFPASNSTLYFEQARDQLNALATHRVFDSPIRLVGLFAPRTGTIPVTWTEYTASRYSRTVRTSVTRQCTVGAGRNPGSRCRLTLA